VSWSIFRNQDSGSSERPTCPRRSQAPLHRAKADTKSLCERPHADATGLVSHADPLQGHMRSGCCSRHVWAGSEIVEHWAEFGKGRKPNGRTMAEQYGALMMMLVVLVSYQWVVVCGRTD
jgi:hypothetical protein